MSILTQIAPPAAAPVSRDMFKAHLRLPLLEEAADDPAQEAELDAILRAAAAAIELRTGRAMIAQDWEWRFSSWPRARCAPDSLRLPLSPVSAIHAVTLYDADGGSSLWDAAHYTLIHADEPQRLLARKGWFPAIAAGGYAEIAFTVGFGDGPDAVPPDLRQAALLLAAHYHENRDAAGEKLSPMPFGVAELLEPYRHARL